MYIIFYISLYIFVFILYVYVKENMCSMKCKSLVISSPEEISVSSFWEYHFLDTLSLISATQISTSFFNIQMNSLHPPSFVTAGNPVSP